ncbi:hypothetical protein AAFF_G00215210 [Aldrovandia affinis]|uniref:Uncharacterized protein n=1 Tax=Aldrovandia affinis TaxID=143900 RepID=A0AAD7RGR2_9TELE|nr:hypothetical protein AAFF_G00215210 [Aldrovandia affinis]
MEELKHRGKKREGRHRDTWDPFQLNPIGAEKEQKRRCFTLAQHLVALIVGLFVLASAVISKICLIEILVSLGTSLLVLVVMPQFDVLTNLFSTGGVCFLSAFLQASKLENDATGNFTTFCSSLANIENKNTTQIILTEISRSICRTMLNSHYATWPFSMLALEGLCMWLGLMTATYYVWKMKVQRIERTTQLFVRRLYESAFIDQSMLLNTKMKVVRSRNQDRQVSVTNCSTEQ